MDSPIHQELSFNATPARVYEVLTTAEIFEKMSGGAPTEIDPAEGGAFSCFGGMIVGRNIECVPGALLVQAWRVKNWEPGVYSIARFEVSDDNGSTKLVFDHTGFPAGQGEHLAQGWHDNYWNPLKQLLES